MGTLIIFQNKETGLTDIELYEGSGTGKKLKSIRLTRDEIQQLKRGLEEMD